MYFKKLSPNIKGQIQIIISGVYVGTSKFYYLNETSNFLFCRKTGATVYVDRMSGIRYSEPCFYVFEKTKLDEIDFFGGQSREFEYNKNNKKEIYNKALEYFNERIIK